jgi:hypothetical protein
MSHIDDAIDNARTFIDFNVKKKIKQEDGKWCVYSEDGTKNLGCYKSKEEATERLRQIEGHKKGAKNAYFEQIVKGLPAELTESGIHIHGLEREHQKTKEDGAHEHIFLYMEDTDEYGGFILVSDEDGAHTHKLSKESADKTEADGKHSHYIVTLDKQIVETSKDAEHRHGGLQVSTSAFDGGHTHQLKMPDGSTLTSLTGGQVWKELDREYPQEHLPPLPPASVFAEMSEGGRGILRFLMSEKRREDRIEEKTEKQEKLESEESKPQPIKCPSSKFSKQNRDVRIIKAQETEEVEDERIIFGVVLVPNDADAQGDIYDEAEVRKAAYSYMEIFGGHIKLMHRGKVLTDQVKLLETYIAKAEEVYGDEVVPVGTWLLAARVCNDDLWVDVKEGKWTGWSIGGSAVKEALD